MSSQIWRIAALTICTVPLAIACSASGAGPNQKQVTPPGPDDIPESVFVSAASVTSGVAIGKLQKTEDVSAFRIAKHPVTVAQFRACVAAGGCADAQEHACFDGSAKAPFDRPTLDLPGGDKLPATCVGVTQTKAFCAWVGGTLPTVPQYLLAVRGPKIARFAWGNTLPACEQRPEVPSPSLTSVSAPCASNVDPILAYAIGQHPGGASPSGVEDVLLSPGELIDVSPDAYTTACVPPFGSCVAYGLVPGAIDGFEPVSAVENAIAHNAYGFRCVWK